MPEQLQDADIIRRILDGETALFEILVRRNNAALYKTGRSYSYGHEDTQDLMQDTFVDAYTHLINFEGRSSFRTWLIRIMLNNCHRKQQKFSTRYETVSEAEEKAEPMFTKATNEPVSTVMNKELGMVVEHALQQIPREYRMVFALREMNGLSVEETSEAMEITQANVKARLSRAKAMLRKEVEKSYSKEEIFEFNLKYCDAMVDNVMNRIQALQTRHEGSIK